MRPPFRREGTLESAANSNVACSASGREMARKLPFSPQPTGVRRETIHTHTVHFQQMRWYCNGCNCAIGTYQYNKETRPTGRRSYGRYLLGDIFFCFRWVGDNLFAVAIYLDSEVLFNNVSIIRENLDNYLRLSLAFLFFSIPPPSVRSFRPFHYCRNFLPLQCSILLPSPLLSLVGVAASIPSSFATAADIHSNSEGLGILLAIYVRVGIQQV